MELNSNIKTIKGIGDKTASLFGRLGVETVDELVHSFPRNYLSYEDAVSCASAKVLERVFVKATVKSLVFEKKLRNMVISTFTIGDSTGDITVVYFNSPYIKNVFKKGDSFVFVGQLKVNRNKREMSMPEYYKLADYERQKAVMQPVYKLTKGLSNNIFKKSIQSVAPVISRIEDYLPIEVVNECGLMPEAKAIENMHFPPDKEKLVGALNRIAFDEFYGFICGMARLKASVEVIENKSKITQGKCVNDFIKTLPYTLTKGQTEAIEDILSDMGSTEVMNRLLEGDVGSGKTVVAAAVLFAAIKEGYQGALMAPTEVLARQHFDEFERLYKEFDIKVACLVGSTPIKEKREIYQQLKAGQIDLVIGTHALIFDKVEFKNLALCVVDEQHRFGVKQRAALSAKGDNPHVLYMSATPIPRTLAIVMYADLDLSVIKELPKGRKPIKNAVVGENYRVKLHKFIEKEVSEGGQAYIICPMIEDGETTELQSVEGYQEIFYENVSKSVTTAVLHGKMPADEKNDILDRFMTGEIKVLISTTVIEVGINNPNASVIIVENAERFGLAQLHQLRGRVGRGNRQSFAAFISSKDDEDTMERLRVLENSNDGYFIASEDLRLRGPGDFFGIRQSGDMEFKIADMYTHAESLKLAREVFDKYGDLTDEKPLNVCL